MSAWSVVGLILVGVVIGMLTLVGLVAAAAVLSAIYARRLEASLRRPVVERDEPVDLDAWAPTVPLVSGGMSDREYHAITHPAGAPPGRRSR